MKPGFKWTQTHGHFAQMGGFARNDNREVIYPPDLFQLLETGELDVTELEFTEKEINDKSKGDILSKALVAFQTTWFIFECLARLQQGLPIIELEVVTLAFATLNAITYGLWWYKPLNVLCPLQDEEEDTPLVRRAKVTPKTQVGVAMNGKGRLDAVKDAIRDVANSVRGVIQEVRDDFEDVGWWRAMLNWLLIKPFWFVAGPLWELPEDNEERFSSKGASNVPTFYVVELADEKFFLVVSLSSFIGMIFGAIHFISWHSTFPSHIQLVLWRTSCIILVVQPFFVMLASLSATTFKLTSTKWLKEVTGTLAGVLLLASGVVGAIPYVLARICVLTLAFLTLRDLPLPAFRNISWTSYIPHF